MSRKPRAAFICTHNSCRSQIAEALGRYLAGDVFESCSGGTGKAERLNPDAVRLMKAVYGIDMEQRQYSKLLEELPAADIVITMGCGVKCPYMPCRYRENWGLDDPTGKADEDFLAVMRSIEEKIRDLKRRIQAGEIVF